MAHRRSGVRLALGASELPEDFLNLSSDQRFVLRLGRLTCGETLRWVRRNLPGLLRYGRGAPGAAWPRMGADLETLGGTRTESPGLDAWRCRNVESILA